ncbi:hypothetical protein SAMN04488134_101691 [Amphibacillus marinus]|uniref:Glycosyl hydrolases related to GH101 family, GHL1-GHL3 n=1 Tax=Amphibacillus marinus TaxID=872970 RepID=A0A1H8IQZ4_9BACI|nr:DUF5696 domain-containing protein [Amphibacillus marinus]SEN70791.1 hypothetical protein SAMN04488134_101691 [Amphibacillus marinus]
MKSVFKCITLITIILSVLLLSNHLDLQLEVNAIEQKDIYDQFREEGKEVVAENEQIILALNNQDFSIAIYHKEDQTIWLSNPLNHEEDEIATGVSRDRLASQLSITYYNRAAQEQTMNSYTDSTLLDQVTVEQVDQGVKVIYTIGEEVSGFLIPDVISANRFETFLNQMDADAQRQVRDIYREDLEEELYYLRSGTAVFIQEDAEQFFADAGYTLDDFIQDNEENAVEGAGGAVFTIPVVYQIEGDTFTASIPVEEIIAHDLYTLTSINLLEYFGTASLADDGYLFVPDGSGALIDLNNGKTAATRYISSVYGYDETLTSQLTTNRDKDLSIRLPIFGLKKQEQAFVAVIEDGETYASVVADVSGKTDSFNKVHTQFSYLPTGRSSLDEMTGSGVLQLFQQEPYQGQFSIRYHFLAGDDADYSGMANTYRHYLEETGVFQELQERTTLPFYLGLTGAIDKHKSFFGIPYQGVETITSYQEALAIIEQLQADQIADVRVKYAGWFNGGINHASPNRIRLVNGMESEVKLAEFATKLRELEVKSYFDVDFGYVYQDNWFDGFSSSSQATRYFDNSLITLLEQDLASGNMSRETATNPPKFILNASHYNEVVDKFMKALPNEVIDHLSMRTITSTVSADFSRRNFVDRQASLTHTKDALAKLVNNDFALLGQNANAYAFNYVQDILEVPMSSNQYMILDEAIPFYQMVLSGYIDYAGQPLNLADNYQHELLKTIETNAGLYVEWIYAPDHVLKETAYQDLYAVHYLNWYDRMVELYHELNSQLKPIQGQAIVKHEIIANDVNRVTYQNGAKVIVNYQNKPFQYNETLIEAHDFVVEEGR